LYVAKAFAFSMQQEELIPHLFRSEYRKIAAVLCKWLGTEGIEAAEDITSDTFLAAMQTWTYKGIPENPVAWLYTVAKNKAKNHLLRQQTFRNKIAEDLKRSSDEQCEPDLSEANIQDSQLQMLFTICHPSLPPEAQIGLALRILCGFGIEEIANAFLTNKETINKRLFRAREKLRQENIAIQMPPADQISARIDNVLATHYLLFSEGYYSETKDSIIREDLCLEAMRLTHLLTEHVLTCLPRVHALLALMCFHASRFPARRDSNGAMVLYDDQDETLWNQELIQQGNYFMGLASKTDHLSKYHLEAAIAFWHTSKADTPEKWERILQLYNLLLIKEYSPIVALNRTYALAKVKGKKEAIREAEKLQLDGNRFYYTLLGTLYTDVDSTKALECFRKALTLSKTDTERQTIRKKIEALAGNN